MSKTQVGSIIEKLHALQEATIEEKTVYHVEGWRDEYGRGRHTIGYTLDHMTAAVLSRGQGFYCDGDIGTKTLPVATFADGTMALVSVSLTEVHPDMVSFEERKKQELQAKARAKLTKEEIEVLGL